MTKSQTDKLDSAIRYIAEHPVQFGAKSIDARTVSQSVDFKNHLIKQFDSNKSHIHKATIRELAKSTWNVYLIWIQLPNIKRG